jgi:hypothetical protein
MSGGFENKKDSGIELSATELLLVQTADDGVFLMKETTAPSQTSGYGKLYVKSSDSKLYFKDDSGNEYDILAGISVPSTITVANEAADTTCFPLFVTAATGDLGPKTNAGLTFNSNTGVLAATGFSGPLTGDVIGNVSGNAGTVTGFSPTAGKVLTLSNTLTLSGTDGSTLAIGTGGTLGTAAYTAATAYAAATHASTHAVGGADSVFPADPGADKFLKFNNTSNLIEWADAGGAGASTALDNLASVAINTTLVSDTDNTDALGTTAIAWSDLFLGSGAVITFNSAPSTPDVTITHSANLLTIAGGDLALGANNLTMTGSLGATGAGKLLKGWFIDLEVTNLPTVNGGTLATALSLGTMASETATNYVAKSLFDANTILYATADNTPLALVVGASTIVGRKATGDIVSLTAAELRTIINVADGATANAKAAGTDVDTGTNDALFLTAKSINDSHNVPMVAPGTSGNVMTSNGTDWTSAALSVSAVQKVAINTTEITLSNNATERTLFTGAIPAGTLSTNNAVRVKVYCSDVDIGSGITLTIKLKYGGSTLATAVNTAGSGSSTNYKGWIEAYLVADGSASAQKGALTYNFTENDHEINAEATVQIGKIIATSSGASTEDSTGALNLVLTVQFSNDTVANQMTAEFMIIEKIA